MTIITYQYKTKTDDEAGMVSETVNDMIEGSLSLTITGPFTTSSTLTVTYRQMADWVSLFFNYRFVAAASMTISASITSEALPSYLWPQSEIRDTINVSNNGTVFGTINIGTDGVVTIGRGSAPDDVFITGNDLRIYATGYIYPFLNAE